MLRAYEYKLKPTSEQRQLLAQCASNARWMYNQLLAYSKVKYEQSGEGVTRYELHGEAYRLAKSEDWLKISNVKSFEFCASGVITAYKNFFVGLKAKRRVGFPKFKKKGYADKFALAITEFRIEDSWIRLGKCGWFWFTCHRPIPEGAKLKRATVKLHGDGNWYVSILLDIPHEPIPKSLTTARNNGVGVDLGLRSFAALCWGEDDSETATIANPKYYEKSVKRLARLQRALSRKAKGSNNREKARRRVAKLHYHIAQQRKMFAHKWSRYLVDNFDCICLETLSIERMLSNGGRLSRSISDASWGNFVRMVQYKAEEAGKYVFQADRWFASTRISYWTGEKNDQLTLADRSWTDSDGNVLDRDINAARNLRYIGLYALVTGEILDTAGFQARFQN